MKGRRVKWTARVFEALLDMTLTNAHIIHENLELSPGSRLGHFGFLLAVHSDLLRIGSEQTARILRPIGSPQEDRLAALRHHVLVSASKEVNGKKVPIQRKCVRCPTAKTHGEFRVTTMCNVCKVFICRKHFMALHVTDTDRENTPPKRARVVEVAAIARI